jgi:hypothetical protein
MNRTFGWYAAAFAGAALLLGACTDVSQQPFAPEMASFNVGTTSSHVPDDLFLIDNNCGNSTPGAACATTPTGSDIFQVNLTGGQAVLSLVKGLHGTCAANSSIDCNTHFNQAHIGVTPNGQQLWAINRNDVGGGGWPAGYVDLTQASHPFTYVGQIQGLGSNGIVMAAFSPAGDLMVANQLGNTLYRVDTSTLAVTGSWEVDINLDGADIAYNAAGTLFLYTNDRAFSTTNGAERGLYTVSLSALVNGEGTATTARVGGNPGDLFFTGLAFRARGTGNLVMSNAVGDVIQEVNPTTGAFGTTYPFYLDGQPYDHQFGDMATGRLNVTPTVATIQGCVYVAGGSPGTGDILGVVGEFTAFAINGGELRLNSASLGGDVGLASGVVPEALLKATVTGTFYHHQASTPSHSTKDFFVTGGFQRRDLSAEEAAVNARSAEWAALPVPGANVLGNVAASLTITRGAGTHVFSINSLNYNSRVLTLSGPSDAFFIFNVSGGFKFAQSQIVLTGGLTPRNVVFNFPTGGDIIEVHKAESRFNGIILAPQREVRYSDPGVFNGAIIARIVKIYSGARIFLDPPCLDGVTMRLTNGGAPRTVVTTTAGYSFGDLTPGTYRVEIATLPAGFTAEQAIPGTPFGGTAANATTITDIVVPPTGGTGTGYDFRVRRN